MTFEQFITIINATSIELYSSEYDELEKAFNNWKTFQDWKESQKSNDGDNV